MLGVSIFGVSVLELLSVFVLSVLVSVFELFVVLEVAGVLTFVGLLTLLTSSYEPSNLDPLITASSFALALFTLLSFSITTDNFCAL
ncbi:hypothetical protein D3C76_1401140 [compost metagenome]